MPTIRSANSQTVNLLVQRNIPVTFAKPPSEVINDTIDPEGDGAANSEGDSGSSSTETDSDRRRRRNRKRESAATAGAKGNSSSA